MWTFVKASIQITTRTKCACAVIASFQGSVATAAFVKNESAGIESKVKNIAPAITSDSSDTAVPIPRNVLAVTDVTAITRFACKMAPRDRRKAGSFSLIQPPKGGRVAKQQGLQHLVRQSFTTNH
jgi:hypothetical protein